ncbi:MAG TPA: FAD-dependent oxidoreductase, partial [Ktedonobacterales bacterium]|nr:FAD-dependent oxidoreductase [Ktedonobacterales bacterium]
IVAAIGVRPNTHLAEGTDLASAAGSGLRVDRLLQTRAAGVHAAGAVADVFNPQTGTFESRGQWYFAFQQGRLAGAALAGAEIPRGAELGAMGAFWHATQLGALRVLAAGAPMLERPGDAAYEVLSNGSSGFHRRLVLRDNRLVGYLAVGSDLPSGLAIKRIIDEELDVRDTVRQLMSEDFDARAFFSRLPITLSRPAHQRPTSGRLSCGA